MNIKSKKNAMSRIKTCIQTLWLMGDLTPWDGDDGHSLHIMMILCTFDDLL